MHAQSPQSSKGASIYSLVLSQQRRRDTERVRDTSLSGSPMPVHLAALAMSAEKAVQL
jgi:hypothetical protein